MDELIRIAGIEDELQAQLVEEVLQERGIPHVLRTYRDSAYDGLFQSQTAWGHVEAPAEFREQILGIIEDLSGTAGPGRD